MLNLRMLRINHYSTTFQLLLMQVLVAATAFIVNVLSATAMEPEGRGYLALLVQITYVLTVAAMLGIDRPYIAARRSNFGEALYELTRLVRPAYVFIAFLAAGVFLLFVIGVESLALSGSLIVLYLVGNVCARLIRTGYIVSGRISPFVLVSTSTQAVLLGAAVILSLTATSNPDAWFLAYGGSGLIAFVVTGYAVARNRKRLVRKAEERTIRRDGLRLLPASFGNTAMLRSDRLLLPLLASNAQLGIYIVVATTMELASWPIQNWVDASLNRWRNSGDAGRPGIKTIIYGMVAAGILALLMGLASLLLIRLMLGPAYAGSVVLIVPLGLAAIVYAASRVQQGIMIASGKSKEVSWTEVIGMVVSVLGYVLLIPTFGALGAALASAVGYAVCFLAGLFMCRRANHTPVS
jgi:O-antigen/teichoic acid export membrane protein